MKLLFVLLIICVVLFSIIEAQNSTENEFTNNEMESGESKEFTDESRGSRVPRESKESRESPEVDMQARRIVGGNFAKSGQYPFLASLRLRDSHFCGGAILGYRWVLTAAHCFDKKINYISKATVVIGSVRLTARGIERQIEGLIPHKLYDESTFTNDICLVRVHPDIIYSDTIQPIAIQKNPPTMGSYVTIIGWGDTHYEGNLSSDLKYTFLQILPNWQCKRMFRRYMSDTLGCGLAGPGEGTCNGDSGGPIVQNGNLIGVSVWGLLCAAGYPDTFTRLHLYVDWVTANTGHYDLGPENFK